MKRAWALKWAKYLEAPRRKQAIGRLDKGKGARCCLGHACVVARLRSHAVKFEDAPSVVYRSYAGQQTNLPKRVQKLFGMKSSIGQFEKDGRLTSVTFPSGKVYLTLAWANDNGETLKDIAAVIRKNWRLL